jgi:hypothetical protein
MNMHDILAAHAASQLRELPLSTPDRGRLTDAEVNSVQAELESMFSEEYDAPSERCRDWLTNNAKVRSDYIQYRVAAANDDEVLAAERAAGIRL